MTSWASSALSPWWHDDTQSRVAAEEKNEGDSDSETSGYRASHAVGDGVAGLEPSKRSVPYPVQSMSSPWLNTYVPQDTQGRLCIRKR